MTAALALLALLVPIGVWGQTRDQYSYTFTAKVFDANNQTQSLDGVEWTFSGTGGNYFGYDGTKGQQFGSGSSSFSSFTLSTSGITGTISQIKVNTSGANSIVGTLNVTVGENAFGNSYTLTSTATEVTFNGSATGAIAFNYAQTSTKAIYIKSISITYSTDGHTTYTLTSAVDPTGTGTVSLSKTSLEPGETATAEATANAHYTFTSWSIAGEGATLYSDTDNPTTVTMGAANATITATFTEDPKYNITYNPNYEGSTDEPVVVSNYAGETMTIADYSTFSRTGYAITSWNTQADGNGTSYSAGDSYTMTSVGLTLYAQWEERTEVVDVLDRALTGITGTSYSNWSNKKSNSDAVYAGNSAGGNNSIQLRSSNNNSGIISTESAGIVTHVVVEWNSNTDNGRTLNVYGKNSKYEAASDLYDNTKQGTLLGTIVKGTSTELTIDGEYAYIGFRSNSGAMYLTSVSITWKAPSNVATPTFSPEGGLFTTAQNVTITCATEGATIYYTTDGTTPTSESTPYTGAINVTETTTIKAIAYYNNEASYVASATYTIVNAYTTIPQIFAKAQEVGSTQTEIYVTFDNWTVVGKSYANAYVTDGQYGLNVYGSSSGFAIGDQLSGTVACKVMLYTQGAELLNLSTTTLGLTVTHDNSFDPYEISLADLTGQGIYFGSYVDLGNLTYSNSKFNDGNGHVINPYNTFNITGYPTLTEGKTYRVKGVYIRYNSTTERIAPVYASDFTEVAAPMLSIDPATAQPFTYVENAGPSDDQMFEVTGTNLTSDDIVATITTGTDYFEITDDETYSSTVTVNNGAFISVRMKAGLALGNYAGALTLTNEGAEDVVVALSGSVTGQTYNIELDDQVEHGTIASDMTSAPAGVTVTLTATPDAGYEFGEWTVLDDGANEIPVTGNQFEMPASDVLVSATFNAKQTYTITTVVTPDSGGTVVTLENAYEGQNVEVEVEAETGFTFSSLVVSKTDDATTTVETTGSLADGYSFTMPNYAVTVTATFISDTYTGSFVLFTEEITEGDYVLVYEGQAMTNTVTSNKFDVTDVTPSGSIITDPSRNIVWHIAPSATTGYWTIKNEKVNKYANSSTATSTNVSLVDTPYDGAKWIASGTDTHDFRPKINEGQSTVRYLRKDARFGAYAASNGGPLTLYKYTILTERTITFNGNGGTYNNETTYTQTVYDGIADNLDVNKFTKEGSAFIGWSTTANGEVEYADGASITVNDDLTLYAQWATSYTAMVDDQIVGGTVKVNDEDIVEVAAGTEMTLTYTAEQGYAFRGWNVYKDEDETTTVTVTDNKFTMPEYDVIVSATFENVATYSLVTNVNQIVSGKHYIIASDYYGDVKVMASQADNNRTTVDAYALWDEVIEETEGIYEFVINGPNTDNYYTIYDVANGGYLYAAGSGSGKNYLRNQATNDENGLWSFSIDNETGAAEVVAQGSNTNNYMRFNNTLFSCYASTSSIQNPVYLFVKDNDNDYEYYGCEVTYAETSIEGSITVGAGSVMTITNNQFNNDDPANLIIEDGGQLIHDNPVSATIQRNITGYGRSNPSGYQFIASPVKDDLNVDETNLTTSGSYDLYIFDQSQPSKEWRNYKANEFTTIGNGVGYLYANTTNITISFSGELKPSDNDVPVTLAYTDGNRCAGWNLIGNPFACKAYIKGATGDIEAFYRMNGNGDGYDAVVGAINPMEGIFVQANDIDQSFYFTRTAPDATPGKGNLNLEIAQVVTNRDARQATDNAIIRFDGGNTLEKFSFSEDNAKLYIPQNGKDYAVVSADTQGEMPVNFKAESNGTYTIAVEPKNVELTYLHLIDNLTGANVDLLANPSYIFEANKGDNANRFRLVFKANADVEDNIVTETFAYFNGSEWVISNTGDATLQVIDMMGRVLRSEQISGNTTVNINEIAGVYMLRLVNGENVMVQKVVVR